MTKSNKILTKEIDRRSVLQTFGTAGVLGLSAGGVQAGQWWNETTREADETPTIRGSVEQVAKAA